MRSKELRTRAPDRQPGKTARKGRGRRLLAAACQESRQTQTQTPTNADWGNPGITCWNRSNRCLFQELVLASSKPLWKSNLSRLWSSLPLSSAKLRPFQRSCLMHRSRMPQAGLSPGVGGANSKTALAASPDRVRGSRHFLGGGVREGGCRWRCIAAGTLSRHGRVSRFRFASLRDGGLRSQIRCLRSLQDDL
jgi:hypothetical protein